MNKKTIQKSWSVRKNEGQSQIRKTWWWDWEREGKEHCQNFYVSTVETVKRGKEAGGIHKKRKSRELETLRKGFWGKRHKEKKTDQAANGVSLNQRARAKVNFPS